MTEQTGDLLQRKAGETLDVLDPPSLPTQPAKPNRWLIVGAGVMISFVMGLAFAGFQEAKDTSLKNLKDVRAYTNVPVLSSIPLLENTMLVRRKKRLAYLAWAAAVIVGAIAVSAALCFTTSSTWHKPGQKIATHFMSRVHDALRRAEQLLESAPDVNPGGADSDPQSLVLSEEGGVAEQTPPIEVANPAAGTGVNGIVRTAPRQVEVDWRHLAGRCKTIPFRPAPEAHLIAGEAPHQVPAEEFRSLRTRLNHLQSQQDLHIIVVTSASPAEGKTFTAVNLALAQAQLETPVLLVDLDLRRPAVHNLFQCERTPGFSDFLLAEKPLEECVRKIEGTNLYFLPAGSQVKNPLELLNMRHVKQTLDGLRKLFNWVILDTPPLLFSADANQLTTQTEGTIIVVRHGSTTYDNVIRAMQSLCENNVLGIVANGARAGELYSKYTYYYSKHDDRGDLEEETEEDTE